jgi:hypothetical protein
MWQAGDRFIGRNVVGWTVLDFDYLTETVLGIHDDGTTQIFYFNEVERLVQ